MSTRLLRRLADVAGVASLLFYAFADAMASIDRALTWGRETCPDTVPDYVDDGSAS